MKKWLLAGVLTVMTIDMTGCTPGNNVPGSTAAGALAGGLVGNQLFHGKNAFAGVLAGALIGGVIGDQIGQHMDKQDQINMKSAVINTPMNQEATWKSDKAGPGGRPVTYTVRPVRNFSTAASSYCREYQTTVTVGGEAKHAYGKACRNPDGSWKILS